MKMLSLLTAALIGTAGVGAVAEMQTSPSTQTTVMTKRTVVTRDGHRRVTQVRRVRRRVCTRRYRHGRGHRVCRVVVIRR